MALIRMPHPSMALNAPNLYPYRMWNTRYVDENVTPRWLTGNIAAVASSAPGGRLAALIFNCHGVIDDQSGEFLALAMGTGVELRDVKKHFYKLKPLVREIYIIACQAANGKTGRHFCSELAKRSGADVYASAANQGTCPFDLGHLEPGYIDEFEGQVLRFPHGGGPPKMVTL
jgi:hypothetical protein